jgi:hypothetical protein
VRGAWKAGRRCPGGLKLLELGMYGDYINKVFTNNITYAKITCTMDGPSTIMNVNTQQKKSGEYIRFFPQHDFILPIFFPLNTVT